MTSPRDRNGFGAKTHDGVSFHFVVVECPRCGVEIKISEDAEWFRCLKCSHEGSATDAEVLDG